MEYIHKNIQYVNNKINEAVVKSNRTRKDVLLLGVTKTIDIETIDQSIKYGITDIGENKVQEINNKYEFFKDKVKIHMIGHLQTNKVKYIIDKVNLIHSVDTLKLAEKISIEASKLNKTMEILIQVNISNEDSKFGVNQDKVYELINNISNLSNVKIKGLMMIAPFVENPEENRVYFKQMHKLFLDIRLKNINNVHMDILSMGMSNDYLVAIEEGSTIVRVGTSIFGKRDYTKSRGDL